MDIYEKDLIFSLRLNLKTPREEKEYTEIKKNKFNICFRYDFLLFNAHRIQLI